MGHTRAYAYVHNAPLPKGGSFQEQLLAESILRERNEKFTLVSLFVRMLGVIAGLKSKDIDDLLESYKEELYQFRYNFEYTTRRERRSAEEAAEAINIARMFKRLEAMTVEDKDIPTGEDDEDDEDED